MSSWNYGTAISILISILEMATIAGALSSTDWVQWIGLKNWVFLSGAAISPLLSPYQNDRLKYEFLWISGIKIWEPTKIYQDISRWIIKHDRFCDGPLKWRLQQLHPHRRRRVELSSDEAGLEHGHGSWGSYEAHLLPWNGRNGRWLVGGFKHGWIIFHFIYGILIPTDFHIFQRGWNHQPDEKSWEWWKCRTLYCVKW